MFHDEEYQQKRRAREERMRTGKLRRMTAEQGSRDEGSQAAETEDYYKRPVEPDTADDDYPDTDYEVYENPDGFDDTEPSGFRSEDPFVRRNPERDKRDEYLRRLDHSRRGSDEEDHMRRDDRDTSHEEDDLDPMHQETHENRYSDTDSSRQDERKAGRRSAGGGSASSGKQIVGETAGFISRSGTMTKVLSAVAAGLVLLLMILGIIFIVNFFRDRANAQLTPRTTAQELLDSLREDDYDRYRALFPGADGQESFADRTTFEGLKDGLHADALGTDYILIRQGNGRDILIAMEFNEDTDEYEIHDVRIVPDEDKGMFVY